MGNATYLRRPAESEKHLYVIGRISGGEWSRVLCMTSASGAKTLPVFSHREAARRFLRASPLRFNLLGEADEGDLGVGGRRRSRWVPRRHPGITLDLSPETLCGECATEPLAEVT